MIVLFVNPKQSNRVNYQASSSEDENKVDRALLNTVCDTEVLISRIYVACVSGQRFNGDGGHIMQRVESEHYYLL